MNQRYYEPEHEYETVWTTTGGWADPALNCGAGALLPDYHVTSTLWEGAVDKRAPRETRPLVVIREPLRKPSRVGEAQRTAMRAMRADGAQLKEIAWKHHVSLSTVCGIVSGIQDRCKSGRADLLGSRSGVSRDDANAGAESCASPIVWTGKTGLRRLVRPSLWSREAVREDAQLR